MISKVNRQHTERSAYIYIRQSTMAQVRHHPESTERQYAFKEKAMSLGWDPTAIRILDRDLGLSGAQASTSAREDFKTLVADVSMGRVGCIFALEASRLARSSLEWHRLIEISALTKTLVVDEDGCYDPSDFNDALLIGLKGTIAQAELHYFHGRLQKCKLNKARKGELRTPLPVGFCYHDNRIVLDPDQEVQGAVGLAFSTFREMGTAYAVVRHFSKCNLQFPKRAYGGAWDGKLIWGRLTYSRVCGILKNPTYAGAYVYGRYRSAKEISPDGDVHVVARAMPLDSWLVNIQDHHESYITWEEFIENRQLLEANRTNGEATLVSGPAREGAALFQGLLLCGLCGHRLTVRYKANGGVCPYYECNWRKRDGLSASQCMSIRSDFLDAAITNRVFEVLKPAQLEIALKALEQLQNRDQVISKQWQMRIERAKYEAQSAERRYTEVDPSNRLVAATLERSWNDALLNVANVKQQHDQFQQQHALAVTAEQKKLILALSQDLPRLWHEPTTTAKDRKRMLRLLIKDITVDRAVSEGKVTLHLRWHGGCCEDIGPDLPQKAADKVRYPEEVVERVRELALELPDALVAKALNKEGRISAKGKPFNVAIVRWIRFRHEIPAPELKRPDELTVKEVAVRFAVSNYVVYYWIKRGLVKARRTNHGSPYWITIGPEANRLTEWVQNSSKIPKQPGALVNPNAC